MKKQKSVYRFRVSGKLTDIKKAISIVNEYCEHFQINKNLLLTTSRKANLVLHRKALLLILKEKGFNEPLIGFILRRDRTTLIKQYSELRDLRKWEDKMGLISKEFRLAEDYEKNFQRAS